MPDLPASASPEPLRAHAWVVPDGQARPGAAPVARTGPTGPAGAAPTGASDGSIDGSGNDSAADSAADVGDDLGDFGDDVAADFARRVEERLRVARYAHSLKRVVHSPEELARSREIEQQAAVWVPVVTFTVTAVCAVLVVLLATSIAGDPDHGRLSEAVVAVATVGFLVAGFLTLTRSQDHFDARLPGGRLLRTDLADAYETVRDGAAVLVELGVPPAALARVADLLPQAERLADFLVAHEARGGAVRGHPAYDQLILMGAEVTVLTDMAEERMGRRSSRRRDRPTDAERPEQPAEEASLTPFDTLADLVAMLGPDVPRTRLPRSSYDV